MYESYYNFTESPFRLTPDPRFYFSSTTHKRALTHLRFGFHQREGFVVITGKPGTGKTELMLHLLEGLPQDRITYGKIVTSNLDANEILQQVAAAFNVPAQGLKKGILLKKLEDVFLQHVRENKRLVLIVDEAHKLSVNSLNELQMLTNFQLSGKAALQCFLSGHDSLKLSLHNPELLHLKQRVITSTFLMPLEKQETQEYIEHRLRCVGWEGDPKFNLSAYTLIHDTTEGIPRQINALCNRILLRAYAEQKHYIDESMVSRAIDDVASEPLAANVLYQQALSETMSEATGVESFEQSSGSYSQQSAVNYSVSNEEAVAHEVVSEEATFPDNDQDETLPLPSAVNGISHSLTGDSVTREASWSIVDRDSTVLPGSTSGRPGHSSHFDASLTSAISEQDDEVLDEARKMSDALSDFHNETASKPSNLKVPAQNSGRNFHIVPESQAAPDYGEKHSTDLSQQTKTTRTWAAPLVYGSAALLLIAGGMFLWIYKFSNDVMAPLQVRSNAGDTLVATIKGMLPEEHDIKPAIDNDSTQKDSTQNESQTAETIAPSDGNESLNLAGIGADEGIASRQNSMPLHDELMSSDNVESSEEQWDSGALGGQFLTEQVKQPSEQAAGQVAAQDSPLPDSSTNANSFKPGEQQKQSVAAVQSEDIASAKEDKSSKKELAVASVVTAPKANKSPALAASQAPPKPTTVKTQSKSVDTTISKISEKPAPTSTPAKKPSTLEATASKQRSAPTASAAKPSIAKESGAKKSIATTGTVNAVVPTRSSKNVIIVNPAQVSSVENGTVTTDKTNEDINKAQLNDLLARLTAAYENGNLNQLLSVLSKDVRSNDGSTRRDLKNGYRKLFNITDMRKMTISSVNWSKKKRVIRGEGEFELHVREKGADTITSYGGIISLEVDDSVEGAVITRLDYDYKK
jgi:type II secretory pathway predicted ATPase ExeA